MNIKNRLHFWLLNKLTNGDIVVIVNANLNVDKRLDFGNKALVKNSLFVGFGRETDEVLGK